MDSQGSLSPMFTEMPRDLGQEREVLRPSLRAGQELAGSHTLRRWGMTVQQDDYPANEFGSIGDASFG